ncbi:type 2 lantibiotic biosynthesis protein LanM [Vibrio campbellii]|uniref:DUF4135 domain-containing protein n=1 Tax=Vibrio campbellii TaxID=680 RepID=UPI000531F1F1|nr:DUF4135 domain-containing protein [Vibrio campbellii]KGR33960.1 type 2 lantibiotic biosynthesis protein LanM [Vibrio campbellii]
MKWEEEYNNNELEKLNNVRNLKTKHHLVNKELIKKLDEIHFETFNIIKSNFKENINSSTQGINKKLESDKNLIKAKFKFTFTNQLKVSQAGDYHDKGHAVCIISNDLNQKFIFKPRNSSALFSFYALIKKISPSIPLPKYIDSDTYSWVEYLEEEPNQFSNSDLHNLGIILGTAFCTNTSDLISENFILTKDGAIPVDVEVFCRPIIKGLAGEVDKLSTVLGTGMLPVLPEDRKENTTITEIALNLYSGSKKSAIEHIIEGFTTAYLWFMNNKKISMNIQGRILIRYTETYSNYLHNMYLPSVTTHREKCKKYRKKLEKYLSNVPNKEQIINSEIEQLLNNDIPSFYYKSNGKIIFNENYNHKINALNYNSNDALEKKISQLSILDLQIQSSIIRDALGVTSSIEKKTHTDILNSQKLSTFLGNMYLSKDRILHLCTKSFYYGLNPDWYPSFTSSKLPSSETDTIYSKFDLFFKLLIQRKSEEIIQELQIIKNEINNITSNDAYHGRSGLLLSICLSFEITKSALSKEIADSLYYSIINDNNFHNHVFSSKFKKPQTGFAYGASGVALALWRYSELFSNSNAKYLARKIIDWEDKHYMRAEGTWKDFRETKYAKKINHAYCNGSVGCLIARAKIFNKEEFSERKYNLDPLVNALENENNLGWCHGISAYYELILSLEEKDHHISKRLIEYIPNQDEIKTNSLTSLSLMNGLSGLTYIYKNKKRNTFISPISFLTYEKKNENFL